MHGEGHTRRPVWVGRVNSQVRREDKTGRVDEWLAAKLVAAGVERLGWITATKLDALIEGGGGLLQGLADWGEGGEGTGGM